MVPASLREGIPSDMPRAALARRAGRAAAWRVCDIARQRRVRHRARRDSAAQARFAAKIAARIAARAAGA